MAHVIPAMANLCLSSHARRPLEMFARLNQATTEWQSLSFFQLFLVVRLLIYVGSSGAPSTGQLGPPALRMFVGEYGIDSTRHHSHFQLCEVSRTCTKLGGGFQSGERPYQSRLNPVPMN